MSCMYDLYTTYNYIHIHIHIFINKNVWMQNTLNQQMNLGAKDFIEPFHPWSHLGPRHAGWCWRHFDLDSCKTVFLIKM